MGPWGPMGPCGALGSRGPYGPMGPYGLVGPYGPRVRYGPMRRYGHMGPISRRADSGWAADSGGRADRGKKTSSRPLIRINEKMLLVRYTYYSLSSSMEIAFGCLHHSGRPPSAAPPHWVESIMLDGKLIHIPAQDHCMSYRNWRAWNS